MADAPELPNDELEQQLKTLQASLPAVAAASIRSTFEGFSRLHGQRAKRLQAVEEHLSAHVPENDPAWMRLRKRASHANALAGALDVMGKRLTHDLPSLGEGEWLVFGEVVDGRGQPVTNVRVRLFDQDNLYDDVLGDTLVDGVGAFSIKYHERDFQEHGEELPELYVTVEDKDGNALYTSEGSVRHESGRVEYFQIALS